MDLHFYNIVHHNTTRHDRQKMPTSCKKSCVACQIVIEFNKYGTTNTFIAFTIEQLQMYYLSIVTILMTSSLPLFNTIYIYEILQSIYLL
jgi:hypothetical protein